MSTNENQVSTLYKLNENVIGNVSRLKKIAITSGKGGVGKTNVVVNLGVALARMDMKVAILDADYGLGNIDILLGIEPELDMSDLLKDTAALEEILISKNELLIIPASSGVQSLTHLTEYQEILLYKELKKLEKMVELLIIDTAAGISDNVISLLLAADEVYLVVSPENTSIVDAYAVVKVVTELDAFKTISVIVNMVEDEAEASEVFLKISRAVKKFLNKELHYLGCIRTDDHLVEAIKFQRPVVEKFPDSPVTKDYLELSKAVIDRVSQMKTGKDKESRLDF
ncbi:MAG: MinD/ParA family protein [Candidatus Aminicenantes bacterium]|nr:MAG: MinD/ParA family protein [Candidatus Aminicenantes bacterium]